jgi:hypothetical protein
MVNFQFNLASVSGIVLAVGGAALFAVRSLRPQLARDTDVFFAAVGLLCGLILVFYGWRFDPLMQFGQVLLTGAAIFFVIENLRLRQVTTEQAKRNTPIVDSERPVSRKYQAEMEDDYAVRFDERDSRPRIRDSRRDEYEDRPRRSSVSRPSEARLAPADRARRNRPARDDRFDDSRDSVDDWGENRSARARNTPPRSEGSRRRRSVEDVNSPDDASYVDYRPIDDREKDNWE